MNASKETVPNIKALAIDMRRIVQQCDVLKCLLVNLFVDFVCFYTLLGIFHVLWPQEFLRDYCSRNIRERELFPLFGRV